MSRPTRIPIQTGASSVFNMESAILSAAFFMAGLLGTHRWPVGPLAGLAYVTEWIGIVMLLVGVGFVWKAFARRASDMVFSAEGISVEGGPFSGRSWHWRDVNPRRCLIREGPWEVDSTGEKRRSTELYIEGSHLATSWPTLRKRRPSSQL